MNLYDDLIRIEPSSNQGCAALNDAVSIRKNGRVAIAGNLLGYFPSETLNIGFSPKARKLFLSDKGNFRMCANTEKKGHTKVSRETGRFREAMEEYGIDAGRYLAQWDAKLKQVIVDLNKSK